MCTVWTPDSDTPSFHLDNSCTHSLEKQTQFCKSRSRFVEECHMRSSSWVGFYKIWMIASPKMATPSRKSKKSNSREKVKVKEVQMMRGPKDGCLEIIKWAISTLPLPASPRKDRWRKKRKKSWTVSNTVKYVFWSVTIGHCCFKCDIASELL